MQRAGLTDGPRALPVPAIFTANSAGSQQGAMTPSTPDGWVSPNELSQLAMPQLPLAVQIRGTDARVVYAGGGVLQINVEVPLAVGFGNSVPLTLTVGGQSRQFNVTLATN